MTTTSAGEVPDDVAEEINGLYKGRIFPPSSLVARLDGRGTGHYALGWLVE